MKKLLVFILLCVSSTIMFAQQLDLDLHYTASNEGCAAFKTYMTSLLYINDVEQKNGNLEVGVFDQDGICRGAKLPKYRANKDYWYYQIEIFGDEGFSYTFKVYDHVSESELDLTMAFPDDEITWGANKKYGSLSNLYYMNFTQEGGLEVSKTITGYGEENFNTNLGYYLIASPFAADPTTVAGMTDGDYDLFAFNGLMATEEWRNYKTGEFTTLTPGEGYLYANKEDVVLTVSGTETLTEFEHELVFDDAAPMGGWNLLGNPYTVEAYVNFAYYTMDGEGYVSHAASDPIGVMSGVLIEATEGGQTAIFTLEPSKKDASLSLNVSSESKLVDRAIVCFGSNSSLGKMIFRENDTKIYMTQNNKDYAVVSAEDQGEMPVSFKAEKNGTYNISFNAQNAEFSYLHLIDNMTGSNVDLLATPSYSFNANTNDYASRFKLVFAKSNEGNDSFGFISDGNLLIYGIEGEATVQVIDVTGRILSSETFSGSYSKALNAADGVYMVRLIQGENVRTQKIVVK